MASSPFADITDDLRERKQKNGQFRFAREEPDSPRETSVRDLIRERAAQSLKKANVNRTPMWYQTAAAASLMQKNDTILKICPGGGKSFAFQLLALANMSKVIMVLCPLVSLMEDQVSAKLKLRECKA